MTTAKHELSSGLQHENCYSGSNETSGLLGLFFLVGEEKGANFLLAEGGLLWSSPIGKKLFKNCIFMAKSL